MPPSDPPAVLQADCARCRALCCVGPAFGASAAFLGAAFLGAAFFLGSSFFASALGASAGFMAGVAGVIERYDLPWHVVRLGCRVEYLFRRE